MPILILTGPMPPSNGHRSRRKTLVYRCFEAKGIHTDSIDGFDVVAECTGVQSIVNDAINYVSRGGTLLVYGVYADSARVSWSPTQIFLNEIRIIGSFAQTYCFPRAVDLLDSGKIRTNGMV
jgi:D-arabinitol dehydrogenase (NADP+)